MAPRIEFRGYIAWPLSALAQQRRPISNSAPAADNAPRACALVVQAQQNTCWRTTLRSAVADAFSYRMDMLGRAGRSLLDTDASPFDTHQVEAATEHTHLGDEVSDAVGEGGHDVLVDGE